MVQLYGERIVDSLWMVGRGQEAAAEDGSLLYLGKLSAQMTAMPYSARLCL